MWGFRYTFFQKYIADIITTLSTETKSLADNTNHYQQGPQFRLAFAGTAFSVKKRSTEKLRNVIQDCPVLQTFDFEASQKSPTLVL